MSYLTNIHNHAWNLIRKELAILYSVYNLLFWLPEDFSLICLTAVVIVVVVMVVVVVSICLSRKIKVAICLVTIQSFSAATYSDSPRALT